VPSPLFFDDLELALTRGGVAPVYVRRTLLELREHYEDLESDARAAGMSNHEAECAACAMLGNQTTIASVILAHPELRAWTHRWPRTASWLRIALVVATFPEAPAMFCVDHGHELARWTMAVGIAALLMTSLHAYLNSLIVLS